MQTPHYSVDEFGSSYVGNVIVETLRQTSKKTPINLSEIAQASRTTSAIAGKIVTDLTGLENPAGADLGPSARIELAHQAVRLGVIHRAMQALSWQEFEAFALDCFGKNGFETQKGMVVRGNRRLWQIDVIAEKRQILLSLDCKHWESPNYPSRFKPAIQHQKESLRPLVVQLRRNRRVGSRVWALPMILTLSEPRESVVDSVVMTSVGQLADFLEHLTPYDPALPFVPFAEMAESPIC